MELVARSSEEERDPRARRSLDGQPGGLRAADAGSRKKRSLADQLKKHPGVSLCRERQSKTRFQPGPRTGRGRRAAHAPYPRGRRGARSTRDVSVSNCENAHRFSGRSRLVLSAMRAFRAHTGLTPHRSQIAQLIYFPFFLRFAMRPYLCMYVWIEPMCGPTAGGPPARPKLEYLESEEPRFCQAGWCAHAQPPHLNNRRKRLRQRRDLTNGRNAPRVPSPRSVRRLLQVASV